MQVLKQDFFAVKRTAMVIHAPFSGTLVSGRQAGLEFVFKSKQGLKL